jgi:hypothetical protein
MAITDFLFRKEEHEFGWKDTLGYSKYLARAKEEIKIVAGELYANYYSNPVVLKNFEQAIKNNVTIKVIFGPAVYIECKHILKLAYEGKIELFKLSDRIAKHFRVVDKQNVYISEPHSIDVDPNERKDKFIEWDIRPNPHGVIYENIFDRLLKDHAERVRDIIEAFKERKVEFYNKEGDKEGGVKTAYGFIKMEEDTIRSATDEEINDLKRYIGYIEDDNDAIASS